MEYTVGYLPHEEGDWNINQSYTPMAVVYNEGTSYISKVDVPTGVALTNTYYWHPFANGTQGADGAQGTTGAQGIAGEAAAQGAQGASGSNGTNGTNGSSIFFYLEPLHDGQEPDPNRIFNPMRLRVNPGNILVDVEGQVGYIGDDGKWKFAYVITQGAQGPAGANGVNGINGIDGVQGYQGTEGTQGIQGERGPAGGSGPDGLQGPIGTQGNDGAQGADGSQGATGTQGADGSITAGTDVWTFNLIDGTTVTRKMYYDEEN